MTAETPSTAAPIRPARSLAGRAPSPGQRRPGEHTANGADAQSKEGRLLIFPAWVKHNVPANDGQTDRISISFNLMFSNFTETMASPMWDATAGKEKV